MMALNYFFQNIKYKTFLVLMLGFEGVEHLKAALGMLPELLCTHFVQRRQQWSICDPFLYNGTHVMALLKVHVAHESLVISLWEHFFFLYFNAEQHISAIFFVYCNADAVF